MMAHAEAKRETEMSSPDHGTISCREIYVLQIRVPQKHVSYAYKKSRAGWRDVSETVFINSQSQPRGVVTSLRIQPPAGIPSWKYHPEIPFTPWKSTGADGKRRAKARVMPVARGAWTPL